MKALFGYRLLDALKSLVTLIAVLMLVPLLLSITLAGSSSTMSGTGSFVGSIWALVIGIVVLRGDLRLGNQFGLSRRSAFWGSVLSCTAAFAAASVVLSSLTAVLQVIYRGVNGRVEVMDIYQFVYGNSTASVMCGDVDFPSVEPLAGAVTPVPGGVGTVTSTVLVGHVIEAAAKAAGIESNV